MEAVAIAAPLPPNAGPAFEQAVVPFIPRLRAQALRLTKSPADADDLVQESLLRAFRFWRSYREDRRLGGWLSRIVKNTFINRHRRQRREREALGLVHDMSLATAAQAPQDGAAERALSDEVEHALSDLSPEYRKVLWAVAVDELTYGEAANELGCPVGTVMSRLHRARRAVAPAIAPYARTQGAI